MSYPERDYREEDSIAAKEPRLVVEVARANEILKELREVHGRLADRLRHVTLERPKAVETGEDGQTRGAESKTVSSLQNANDGFDSEIAKIRGLLADLEV